MWKSLGSLRETVREGFQEFSRDALRETSLIKEAVVENVIPVTKSIANVDIVGRRLRGRIAPEEDTVFSNDHNTNTEKEAASLNKLQTGPHPNIPFIQAEEEQKEDEEEGWGGQLTPLIPILGEGKKISLDVERHAKHQTAEGDSDEEEAGEGWQVDDLLSPESFLHEKLESIPLTDDGMDNGYVEYQDGNREPDIQFSKASDLLRRPDIVSAYSPPKEAVIIPKEDQTPTEPSKDSLEERGGVEVVVHEEEMLKSSKEAELQLGEQHVQEEGVELQVAERGELQGEFNVQGEAVNGRVETGKDVGAKDLEIERLLGLKSGLEFSLKEALDEKDRISQQLKASEDEKESLKERILRLESQREEDARAEEQTKKDAREEEETKAGEELLAARLEQEKLLERVAAAEAIAEERGKEAISARKEREAFEQKVKSMTSALEKRMNGLMAEAQSRQQEIVELREENEGMQTAFSELKKMLREAVRERDEHLQRLGEREKSLEGAKAELKEAQAETEAARREAADAGVSLAEALSDIRSLREKMTGQAMGEDERQKLEEAARTALTSAEAAQAEAASWQARAVTAEAGLKDKREALSQLEADLALANERVSAAESDAEEARRQKAEAEGTSEQLREQTERRAKVFNAAVKAAVNKIQNELEGERDSALSRLQSLESEMEQQERGIVELKARLASLGSDLEASRRLAADREAEVAQRQREVEALRGDLLGALEDKRKALKQAAVAGEASTALSAKVLELEKRCEALQESVELANERAENLANEQAAERERWSELVSQSEREKMALKISSLEASAKAGDQASALQSKIAELEAALRAVERRTLEEVADAERATPHSASAYSSAASVAARPAATRQVSALEGLGLDKVREERLVVSREKGVGKADIEAPFERDSRGKRMKREASTSWLKRSMQEDQMAGRISRRSFILGLYIVLLHIMVMVSFTHRSHPCAETDLGRVTSLP